MDSFSAQIMQSDSCFGASSFSTKRGFSSTLTLLHFIEWVGRRGGDNGCFFRNPGCAVLYCVVLCCAVLSCAMLCCAVLCCAVSCCAVLCCAVLCCCAVLIPMTARLLVTEQKPSVGWSQRQDRPYKHLTLMHAL